MIIVGVQDVKKIKEGTNKNGKPYKMYSVVCEQLDTHEEHKATFFDYGEGIPIVGTEIEADLSKNGKYTNLNKWREIGVKKDLEVFKGSKVTQEEKVNPTPLPLHKTPHLEPVKEGMTKEEWAKKEYREHKRALSMQAQSYFPPITNETPEKDTGMDRWLKVKDLRDCMLTDLYND